MKLYLPPAFAIALFAATAVIAQAPTPTPTPPPVEDGEVVKISTSIIQLDVTVTDKRGRIIRDLRPEEFEIYQNGKKQQVSNISFISSVKEEDKPEKRPETRKDPLAAPTPPPIVRAENVRRTLALVIDDLALSFESAYHTRRALRKFVDEEMREGDLAAIIRTGAGVGALQQFTADKRILYAAIERVKWNPLGKAGVGAFAPIEPSLLEQAAALGDATVTEEDLEQERNFNNSVADYRSSVFATGTLGALQYIVEGMGQLPGRKSVILFSEGFAILQRDSQGFSEGGRVVDYMLRLVDAANRASVVFYAVDPRGLQFTGPTAADNIINPTPEAISRVYSDRSNELFETRAGIDYLAKETGGFAVFNNNDLTWAIRKVLNDQSYYLIAYEPDSDTFDPKKLKYNDIEIRVSRKDTNVRYRSGFINVAEMAKTRRGPAQQTPVQQIQYALTSPFAINDISLSLNSIYGNDPTAGNYVRSLVHIAAKDLKFIDGPNGTKQADFSVLAVSFGDNGVPVDSISKDFTFNANERIYNKMMREGFVYHFAFPVKKPGPYQYRIALRDKNAGTVGSASQFIEVPNLKKSGHAISGIVMQSYSAAQWQQASAATQAAPTDEMSSPLNDTALRQFTTGTILQYSFEVYNARLSAAKRPNLSTKIRVFRDGKIVLDGQVLPVDITGQQDPARVRSAGAISLLKDMPPGDYVLQVIVFDLAAKEKRRIATQAVQFEVIAK